MVFRTAIGLVVVLVTACGRSAPAPKYATGPTPDEFSVYELPEPCEPMLDRVNARGPQRLPAWVELARCVANAAIAQLELDDSADSVALLEEMTGPSFVLLDHVTGKADVATKISALRAKADLYTQMGGLMLATVAQPTTSRAKAWRHYEARRAKIEDMIEPWNERATATHRRIVALGEAHPELASNPEVRLAIRNSERQLSVPIATRED